MANDLIKYGAIAIGGYFILKYMGIDVLSAWDGSVVTTTTPATTTTSPQAQQQTAAQITTLQLVSNAVTAAKIDTTSYQSVDTWNYYYKQVRGIPGPAPETLFVGVDRNKLYSINEWWTAMTGQGFSGFRGLGTIAHYVNPYWNPNGGKRHNLAANGMEKYVIKLGE